SMIYLGTGIAAGRAVGIVVSTGTATQLGKIGRLVATATKEPSPLEIQLANLGRRLVYLVLAIAAIVMITGWLRGDGLWLMVEVGISLAVAAVPEGLPAVTTLILALGLLRMARQSAIVRHLSAVETLGSNRHLYRQDRDSHGKPDDRAGDRSGGRPTGHISCVVDV